MWSAPLFYFSSLGTLVVTYIMLHKHASSIYDHSNLKVQRSKVFIPVSFPSQYRYIFSIEMQCFIIAAFWPDVLVASWPGFWRHGFCGWPKWEWSTLTFCLLIRHSPRLTTDHPVTIISGKNSCGSFKCSCRLSGAGEYLARYPLSFLLCASRISYTCYRHFFPAAHLAGIVPDAITKPPFPF